MKNFVF